jgi:flagellar hook assembly protein FlgD
MATPKDEKLILNQNTPNPFTGMTRIDFTLPDAAQVVLEISDSQGRTLEKLIDGNLAEGYHSTTWIGSNYSPGMYYYSLRADDKLPTKKW